MSRLSYLALIPFLAVGSLAIAAETHMMTTKGSIKVISPKSGQTVTTTDIPVKVAISKFKISKSHVGMPDRNGEGHIHVMLDGMNMGVLYNFYTSPQFTLPGRGMTAGPHTLIFDLASNTHEDFANTAKEIKINYQPREPEAAPEPAAGAGEPRVMIESPADGATVGPKFTLKVKPENFHPAEDLEGKSNIEGYGHYHVFVDEDMSMMMGMSGEGEKTSEAGKSEQQGMSAENGMEMMSMAGMVLMPGSNNFDVDLRAWKNGKHTITVQPVQNDHTPIEGAKSAMITINLKGAAK